MSELVRVKVAISKIYSKYSVYINPVLKFLLALFLLLMINLKMGYMEKINNASIVLMASLFCSFMPVAFLGLLAGLFVLLHFYALSLEVAIVAVVLMGIMYILYLRFASGESIAILLTPIFFMLKIPYIMPLAMGLVGTPFSVVSVAFGVVLSYLINYAGENEELLANASSENIVTKLRTIVDSMIGNKSMICMIICFSVVLVLVYIVRRMSFDHSWKAAAAGGAITNIILMVVCKLGLSLDYSIIGILFGSIVSAALCLVIEFFVHGLDYRRIENLQFEDEEYFYYVKAVPKFGAVRRKAPQAQKEMRTEAGRTVRTANGTRRTIQ